ncbi:MAG TPA: SDR family oxidoreductase [Candidatus Limnocylindrales bacterium]
MIFTGTRVVITGAGRGLGRKLALRLAAQGATLFLSARELAAARRTAEEILDQGLGGAHAFRCDLAEPESVREFAAHLSEVTGHVDVLINNGARYLHGPDLADKADDDIIETVAGAVTGTILLTKHLLPLIRASGKPDIVNIVSAAGQVGHHRSDAHPAFYAAKHAQAGFAEILSHRLRAKGIRVISLFPPDLNQDGPREPQANLTADSVADCVLFAIGQPRDCFIREFTFEQA